MTAPATLKVRVKQKDGCYKPTCIALTRDQYLARVAKRKRPSAR